MSTSSIPPALKGTMIVTAKEKIKTLFNEILEIKNFIEAEFPEITIEEEDWLSECLNDTTMSDRGTKSLPQSSNIAIESEGIDGPMNLVEKKTLVDRRRTPHLKSTNRKAKKLNKRKANRVSPRGKSSAFRGVSWAESYSKWRARACIAGKRMELGFFSEETDAAAAYDQAVYKRTKDVSRLNFPEDYV